MGDEPYWTLDSPDYDPDPDGDIPSGEDIEVEEEEIEAFWRWVELTRQ